MKELRFHKYTPLWVEEFQKIQTFLDSFLANLIIEVHHIGSTSVPNLDAKPIIDIDIEYEEYFDQIKALLTLNGWRYEGEKGIEGRHAFRRNDSVFHEHHLYLCHKDNEELKRHLLFREALRKNKAYRNEYQELKRLLIETNNSDRELYSNSKTTFIEQILKEWKHMREIVFAGGCFWGVEAYFKKIDGVKDTEVGYIAGNGETSYEEVCNGSGHAEAVNILYDEEQVSLKKLLDHLFNIIDPTSVNKQGNDVGVQYRTGIYNYHDSDLAFIENYIAVRQKEYKKPIVLELRNRLPFYKAEEYHQDYLDKNKFGYCHVDLNSHKNVE